MQKITQQWELRPHVLIHRGCKLRREVQPKQRVEKTALGPSILL